MFTKTTTLPLDNRELRKKQIKSTYGQNMAMIYPSKTSLSSFRDRNKADFKNKVQWLIAQSKSN